MKRFIIVCQLALLINLPAFQSKGQAIKPNKYPALLWEISGNGLSKPSYLYGTMHVSDKLAFNLQDTFFIALRNCEAVALELKMEEWMEDALKIQDAELFRNITPFVSKPSGFYQSAFQLNLPNESSFINLLRFSPGIANKMMYRNDQSNSDFEEGNFLDVFIFQAGKKWKKKLIGLEDFRMNQKLSMMAGEYKVEEDDDAEEQKRLILSELIGEKSEREFLEDAYRKGNLDLLDTLHVLSADEGYRKYMLIERNRIMANRMDSIMHTTTLFTGVGAAHLPGKDGIIELLRSMGYKVRFISSNKWDLKTKTDIDETRYPVNFSTRYASDSTFSVALPGKLYELNEEGSLPYFLHNDLSNGSYYCIQRLNHYGRIMQQDEAYLISRIDSLIYENIPGKLLSKKLIKSANGYPGIEIINKTAKGDYQKHQIFITPNEIYSFKVSGIQDYFKNGPEADLFFNSIQFRTPQEPFKFTSNFGFEAPIRGSYAVFEPHPENNPYQQQVISTALTNNQQFDLIVAASVYDFFYLEEDSFEHNMLAERLCLETNKKLLAFRYFDTGLDKKYWFKSASLSNEKEIAYGQIVINGPDYYLLLTNQDSISALGFFNSFGLTPKSLIKPLTAISDTSLYFKANAQSFVNLYTDLLYDHTKDKKAVTKDEKDKKEKTYYQPVKKTKVYKSLDSKEKVMVEYRKFSMYFQMPNMDEFWKYRLKGVSDNYLLKMSRVQKSKKEDAWVCELLLTDTGSSRGIAVKLIQRCGTLYQLRTVIDTVAGLNGFAKTFFDSFAPFDTCIGMDVTAPKLQNLFFSKLYDADSTESKRAKGAIEYVEPNMLAENVPMLIKAIEHPEFKKLTNSEKKELISCFGKVKTKETIPFLERFYLQYVDSVSIEFSILETLVKMKSAEANEAILKLLKSDVPISANEYPINNLFDAMSDSIQNAANLFPDLIRYTKYVEYKNNIYELLAEAIEAGVLKPKTYKKMVPEILLDANYELKKFIADRSRDKEPYSYSNSNSRSKYSLSSELNSTQKRIYNYASVLCSFYNNPEVSKFYRKLLVSTTSKRFKTILQGQLLVNGMLPPDTAFNRYAYELPSRIVLYAAFKLNNKVNMYEKKFLNQQELVISQLFGRKENMLRDSIVLLSVNKVQYKNQPGHVYFFKSREKDKKIWKLSYSAVHDADSTLVNLMPDWSRTGLSFESEKQLQKEVSTALRSIRIDGRKRSKLSDFEISTDIDNEYEYSIY
jgi:uncharacterized protein YbaP (TraB family)